MQAPFGLDPASAPQPDATAEPEGFVVLVEPSDRIHFLDWGGPREAAPAAGVLLVHGIAQTAWLWGPVARRLAARRRVVAMDLRGHGLSDAPTSGYDPATLVEDAVAVADGSGLLAGGEVVIVGHGFGAVVAAWTAAALGERCAGVVLVDGGWEDVRSASELEPAEFLRTLDEPPEVLRSMTAFLADREAFDPPTWDADQERAARATVVETAAGRVVPATRPHALAGVVGALFAYRPEEVLARVRAPVVALAAAEDEAGSRAGALARVQDARLHARLPPISVARFPNAGHNLMRYHPAEVAAAVLAVAPAAPA
jgi:pimeloyl-ACP methyl ester carboxylesterase